MTNSKAKSLGVLALYLDTLNPADAAIERKWTVHKTWTTIMTWKNQGETKFTVTVIHYANPTRIAVNFIQKGKRHLTLMDKNITDKFRKMVEDVSQGKDLFDQHTAEFFAEQVQDLI